MNNPSDWQGNPWAAIFGPGGAIWRGDAASAWREDAPRDDRRGYRRQGEPEDASAYDPEFAPPFDPEFGPDFDLEPECGPDFDPEFGDPRQRPRGRGPGHHKRHEHGKRGERDRDRGGRESREGREGRGRRGDWQEYADRPGYREGGPQDRRGPARGGRPQGSARGEGFFGPEGVFGPNGPFGAGGPFGPSGPFGPGGVFGSGGSGHRGRGGRRGGGRARRGDVRTAALQLIAEEPMNGYQIIQELGERTGGVWRPSPGAIYPALNQLEDEGLIESFQRDGRKAYRLTDAGRAEVDAAAERPRPWEFATESTERSSTGTGAVWGMLAQVGLAASAVAQAGDENLIRAAAELLGETRSTLYRLLADAEADGGGEAWAGGDRTEEAADEDEIDEGGLGDTRTTVTSRPGNAGLVTEDGGSDTEAPATQPVIEDAQVIDDETDGTR